MPVIPVVLPTHLRLINIKKKLLIIKKQSLKHLFLVVLKIYHCRFFGFFSHTGYETLIVELQIIQEYKMLFPLPSDENKTPKL